MEGSTKASDNVSTRLRSAAQGGRSVTLSFGRVGLPMKLVGDAITQAEDEYDACRERFDSYGRAQARQSSLGGGEPLTGTADLTAMDYPRGHRPSQRRGRAAQGGVDNAMKRPLEYLRELTIIQGRLAEQSFPVLLWECRLVNGGLLTAWGIQRCQRCGATAKRRRLAGLVLRGFAAKRLYGPEVAILNRKSDYWA